MVLGLMSPFLRLWRRDEIPRLLDGLIETQISEWQEHYNNLDIDGNGMLCMDEFTSGHQTIMKIIGDNFFDGKKEINFDQYCLLLVLFPAEINENRIKKVYNEYCKKRQPECNGRIKISDFLEINNDLTLTIDQFEDILKHMSNSLSFDFNPGEINYEQFKEFVVSMLTFALMDRDNNRSITYKEVKFFVKFMGACNHTVEEEVREFFQFHDIDDDGEISVYELLLTKYVPMYQM